MPNNTGTALLGDTRFLKAVNLVNHIQATIIACSLDKPMCGFISRTFLWVLKTIVASLKGVLGSEGGLHMDNLDEDDDMSDMSGWDDEATSTVIEVQKPAEESNKIV
ncbi:hypothetical protein FOWG_17183 [Fusarium oxysporum f. sp. lycopersici MN25]|nr:hypothetical protein FOWG_17183 [Fusarium oxysporum f. sp. lycopersici MN25]